MEKQADIGLTDIPIDGVNYMTPLQRAELIKHVNADHGLDPFKRKSLFEMLQEPHTLERLTAGYMGSNVSEALAEYNGLAKPARMLLSLAGFGVGSMIYKVLTDRKHTDYSQETGRIAARL